MAKTRNRFIHEECVTLEWEIQLPRKSPWPISKTFKFRGFEWNMNCVETNQDCIALDLFRCSRMSSYISPFSVSVQVECGTPPSGRILHYPSGTKHRWTPNSITIWSRKINEQNYPHFVSDRRLTFRVALGETEFLFGITPTDTQTYLHSSSDGSTQTDFTVFSTATDCTVSSTATPDGLTIPCLVSLSEDLAKLLIQESDPDIEFQCAGLSIKAHKTVVSARSPVLESMLNSDMVEGRTGKVRIPDMDADTFKQFHQYLYSGKLDELTFDAAMHLYEAGDQYAVHGLTRRCSEFLINSLSAENAYDVLIVADAHSDSKLIEVVVEYMAENKFPLSSNRWSSFCEDQSKLAIKVMNRIFQKTKCIKYEN